MGTGAGGVGQAVARVNILRSFPKTGVCDCTEWLLNRLWTCFVYPRARPCQGGFCCLLFVHLRVCVCVPLSPSLLERDLRI